MFLAFLPSDQSCPNSIFYRTNHPRLDKCLRGSRSRQVTCGSTLSHASFFFCTSMFWHDTICYFYEVLHGGFPFMGGTPIFIFKVASRQALPGQDGKSKVFHCAVTISKHLTFMARFVKRMVNAYYCWIYMLPFVFPLVFCCVEFMVLIRELIVTLGCYAQSYEVNRNQ